MKKISLTLLIVSMISSCGLQVRDNPTITTGNPNTNGNPNTSGETFTVGGHATGIPHGKSVNVTVRGHNYDIDENGTFTFPLNFNSGTSYDVDVVTGPGGAYACTLENDTGTVTNANVTNVLLNCACDSGSLGVGAGTSGNPILVYTSTQLNTISTSATSTSMSKYYKQVCDLDYSSIASPKPIGGNNTPFSGSYDGDGWFILNYTSGSSTASLNDNKGLFGKTQDAILTNINLSNFNITADTSMGGGRVGSLAGLASGTAVTNVYAEDVTIHENSQCLDGVGGLIGNHLKYNCQSGSCTDAELNGVHVRRVDIYALTSQNVGGVFGTTNVNDSRNIQASDIHVHDCDFQCGGIAGSLTGKSSFYEMNAQNITVEGNESVGGITGLNYGVINRSAFVGTVNGKTTAGHFGGIIGNGTTSDPMYNSYTVSDVLSVIGTTSAGRVTGSPSLITNVGFDNTQTCQNCSVNGGTGIGGSTSFKNGSHASQNSWDFVANWCLVDGDFPQLVNVPFSVCEASGL